MFNFALVNILIILNYGTEEFFYKPRQFCPQSLLVG
jgi:hypothetical protein